MTKFLENLAGHYLVLFLMIASGALFFIAASSERSIQDVIGSYWLRLLLWESVISPILFLRRLLYHESDRELLESDVTARDRFLSQVNTKSAKIAEETWYMIVWVWLQAKLKFACGLIITMLTFGIPAAGSANPTGQKDSADKNGIATSIGETDDRQNKTTLKSEVSRIESLAADGALTEVNYFKITAAGLGKKQGLDSIDWHLPGDQIIELLYWPTIRNDGSKTGFGFAFSPTKGYCQAEFNGSWTLSLAGGKGTLGWQYKKGLSGPKLCPDRFQVNAFRVLWPVGRDCRLGPDSKVVLIDGKHPQYRLGGAVEIKLGKTTLLFRHFAEADGSKPPNTELWLTVPLGEKTY